MSGRAYLHVDLYPSGAERPRRTDRPRPARRSVVSGRCSPRRTDRPRRASRSVVSASPIGRDTSDRSRRRIHRRTDRPRRASPSVVQASRHERSIDAALAYRSATPSCRSVVSASPIGCDTSDRSGRRIRRRTDGGRRASRSVARASQIGCDTSDRSVQRSPYRSATPSSRSVMSASPIGADDRSIGAALAVPIGDA